MVLRYGEPTISEEKKRRNNKKALTEHPGKNGEEEGGEKKAGKKKTVKKSGLRDVDVAVIEGPGSRLCPGIAGGPGSPGGRT